MRLVAVFALALSFSACGGDDSGTDAAASQDLTAASGDLATPQSCAQVYACTTGCATPTCTGTCLAAATPTAMQLFTSLYDCAYARCLPSDAGADVDGGAGSCASTTDDTAACNDCVHSAALSPACSTPLAACESN